MFPRQYRISRAVRGQPNNQRKLKNNYLQTNTEPDFVSKVVLMPVYNSRIWVIVDKQEIREVMIGLPIQSIGE